jgi:sugar phosphate isomerase/epimerase
MRLGGPLFHSNDPESWVRELNEKGYRAAYCPVEPGAPADLIREYRQAADENDVVIAEVGAWSDPLSPNGEERKKAIDTCIGALALADEIGANCAVNVAGSRGAIWAGPSPLDLGDDAIDVVAESVRGIIDAVNPKTAVYTLETMQWMIPDSVEAYVAVANAIDRPDQFGVHFDPVNLVNSPRRYYHNADTVRDFVKRLGPRIRSVHLKDVIMSEEYLVHLSEIRAGLGGMDYPTLLRELDTLDADVPVMLEHLESEQEYADAAEYVRSVAGDVGVGV